jgi:hypothetical protein
VAINKDLKERAQKTREDGVLMPMLDEGVSPGDAGELRRGHVPRVSTEDIGVWPADDGGLVVSVRDCGAVVSN